MFIIQIIDLSKLHAMETINLWLLYCLNIQPCIILSICQELALVALDKSMISTIKFQNDNWNLDDIIFS